MILLSHLKAYLRKMILLQLHFFLVIEKTVCINNIIQLLTFMEVNTGLY